jgi:nanoRNase/pAp phosphatase (c-di-AMP/oligoRNAs hydrolase)
VNTVENSASQIKELIQHSRKVLLATSAQGDNIAATLALSESIKQFGREVILVSPNGVEGQQASLPGAQDFTDGVGPRSLVVSLDYQPGSIAKVSYAAEGDKFNLVITPNSGSEVTSNNVSYSYTGAQYDLVIVVGVADLGVLGDLYESEKGVWEKLPVVNIDRRGANTQFGKVNAIDSEVASMSEIVMRLLDSAKLPLPKIAAELLLLGLREASDNFAKATPAIFERAAELARKIEGREGLSSEERLVDEGLHGQKKPAGPQNAR